jgi:predicted dehydrogenase
LLAGKHVLVEKPMAMSATECRDLIQLAEHRRLILMVSHTPVYSPALRAIGDIIASGELGEVRHIHSQRLNLGLVRHDINVAWDLAYHDISIILHWLAEEPTAISCHGAFCLGLGVEDIAGISLEFAGGRLVQIQSSWLHPERVRTMTLVGSKRMLICDDSQLRTKVRIYDRRVEAPPRGSGAGASGWRYHKGKMWTLPVEADEPLKVECAHFVDCIRHGLKPLTSGAEGMQVVRILEAASRSLEAGGKVMLGAAGRPNNELLA